MFPFHYFPQSSLARCGGPPVHEIPRRGLARAVGPLSTEAVIEPGRTATQLAVLACGAALYLSQDARLLVLEDSERAELIQIQPIPGMPDEAWTTLERVYDVRVGAGIPRFWLSREEQGGTTWWGVYDLRALAVLGRYRGRANVAERIRALQAGAHPRQAASLCRPGAVGECGAGRVRRQYRSSGA
jgi:hypothetical protein